MPTSIDLPTLSITVNQAIRPVSLVITDYPFILPSEHTSVFEVGVAFIVEDQETIMPFSGELEVMQWRLQNRPVVEQRFTVATARPLPFIELTFR
ncbi:MAG: hypothetical protein R3C11_24245 [Planctomycetaceae bacterium]